VAITRAIRLPHRRDLSYATTFELPGQLEAAGVRWCLTGGAADASATRNLPYEAAACIAFGLDPDVALRSVTLAPAELLGVGARLGSLEPGKAATLFVADGDPFELWTTIETAWIDGRQIDLSDKQTALDAKYREKYRQLGLLR
jgi:imidazolonepropionase-like amidohydrolase